MSEKSKDTTNFPTLEIGAGFFKTNQHFPAPDKQLNNYLRILFSMPFSGWLFVRVSGRKFNIL